MSMSEQAEAWVGSQGPMPIAMLLWCPSCPARHIDSINIKAHHTPACQHCGMVWRPAIEQTIGVQFLPGFKDAK